MKNKYKDKSQFYHQHPIGVLMPLSNSLVKLLTVYQFTIKRKKLGKTESSVTSDYPKSPGT